jgi:hypothetical protein
MRDLTELRQLLDELNQQPADPWKSRIWTFAYALGHSVHGRGAHYIYAGNRGER